MKRILTALLAALAMLGLVGCSSYTMPAGQQAVVADDYWAIRTAPELIECIPEEQVRTYGSVNVYRYPARQISYDATGDAGAERGPYVVVSNPEPPGQAQMNVPVVVTFDLTTDCEKLKNFHREFGTRDQGWLNEDGTPSVGWVKLLNYVVGVPLQDTLNRVAAKYTWPKIMNDEAVKLEFKEAIQRELPVTSKARTNGVDYFNNFQVTVLRPTPVNGELLTSIEGAQTAQQQAETERIKATADAERRKAAAIAEQDAIKEENKLKALESEQTKILIEAFGGDYEAYLKDQAIKKGISPYPSPIIPGVR